MSWNFKDDTPVRTQIVEKIKQQIASGELKSGEKIDSVREYAQNAGVNPNTMQRALSELEAKELIYSMRTAGRFVTEDVNLIKQIKDEIITSKMDELFDTLRKIGYKEDALYDVLTKKINEMRIKK